MTRPGSRTNKASEAQDAPLCQRPLPMPIATMGVFCCAGFIAVYGGHLDTPFRGACPPSKQKLMQYQAKHEGRQRQGDQCQQAILSQQG